MRCPTLAALLFLAQSIVPGTASAAGEGACTGAACGALALSADGCAWTNTGDKSVRLSVGGTVGGTVGGSGKASPIVMILAPGEMFKASGAQCEKSANGKVLYDASYPALRTMAGDGARAAAKIAAPVPKMKPVAAPAVVVAPAVPTLAVATAAPVPVPRVKPAPPVYPPLPRLKPVQAMAAVVARQAAVSALEPAMEDGACGEACGEILFKLVDSCLWVQSQNPRPIVFKASVAGKAMVLALEGAHGAKADARAAAVKSGAGAGQAESAYHTRLHDPFQSAGAGIPVYRARLGTAASCVKSRDEIARFAAQYAN